MKETILIVDDEKSIRSAVALLLGGQYRVLDAASVAAALKLLERERPDLVLLDIGLPDGNGIELLKTIHQDRPDLPVVMVTAYEETRSVVEAIRAGAYDYLVKPIDAQALTLTVKNTLEARQLKNQLRAIQQPKIDHFRLGVVARSAVIRQMVATAVKAARSVETPVLIDGESGTGKGVLARAIHYSAEEAPGPFVAVNCGAMTEELVESELFGYTKGAFTGARADGKSGHFEAAAGGTLFLDEIGNMPQTAQAKLLGVLEERKFLRVGDSREIAVRCRVVAATNADLETAVQAGRFRADLFYRLNVVRLTLPPLRDRREDILLLAEYFIDQFNRKFHKGFRTMADAAREKLLAYHWPGNVRELKNCIERIILLEEGDTLQAAHFPFPDPPPAASLAMSPRVSQNGFIPYREAVLDLIRAAMQRSDGNVVESARLLQMPVHKLRYRIKKYGLGSPTP